MLTFQPSQFVRFLPSGQTKPALFTIARDSWVFRYPIGARQQLRLASEYMGYRVASWLHVSVPDFCLARMSQVFEAEQSTLIPAGPGTAARWIEGEYPDLEKGELKPYWVQEHYLLATAAVRVADTWMMNYDRRKVGNVVVRGNSDAPEVYFLDFDQAFLAPANCGRGRAHWIAPNFQDEMLKDRELLSGFSGTGKVKSEAAQRWEHFDPCVQRLRSVAPIDVEQAVWDIPSEWGICESDRRLWVKRLLARREIVLEILKEQFVNRSLVIS